MLNHSRALGHARLTTQLAIESVAFSPDGRPGPPQPVDQPLTRGTQAIYSVAFSPNGPIVASRSIDGAIRLWNPTVNYATEWICNAAGDLT